MKELTVKEKAKRYDEAIERAIKHRNNDGLTLEQYETIDIILPELAESEDESIRGAIIDHLKDNNLTEWAVWLEKQGERPTNEKMKELLRTEYEKGRADAIAEIKGLSKQTIEDVARKVTSNKEHATSFLKSTGIMNDDGQLAEEYRTKESDTNKIEQKTDWSKEDEEMLEDVRFNFMYNKEKMTDALIAQYNRFFDKIKSLKPQPQQEWSKEDEEVVEALNYYVRNLDIFYSEIKIGDKNIASKEFREKVQDWLKSHKERYTWKPSGEQIEALERIVNFAHFDEAKNRDIVRILLNELKKLKG